MVSLIMLPVLLFAVEFTDYENGLAKARLEGLPLMLVFDPDEKPGKTIRKFIEHKDIEDGDVVLLFSDGF